MKFADQYERRGLRRQIALERSSTVRSPISRGKHMESKVDWTCVVVKQARSLIDPLTGRFYFVIGASTVGGGDVVRP